MYSQERSGGGKKPKGPVPPGPMQMGIHQTVLEAMKMEYINDYVPLLTDVPNTDAETKHQKVLLDHVEQVRAIMMAPFTPETRGKFRRHMTHVRVHLPEKPKLTEEAPAGPAE